MQNLNQDSQCLGQDLRRALNRSLQHYVRTELLGGHVCMYVCMCKGWAIKSGPCTATFNDLLGGHGGEVLKLLGFPCST
jgi:hypothetical protein